MHAAFGLHTPREQHVRRQHGGGARTDQKTTPGEPFEFSGVPKHTGVGMAGPVHILNFRLTRHISTVVIEEHG